MMSQLLGLDIRPARHADLDWLVSAELACFGNPWSPKEMAAVVWARRTATWIMVCHGTRAGYLIYVMDERYFEILNLAVLSEFRRLRIAQTAVRKLRGKLNEKRSVLLAAVQADNIEARALFSKCGLYQTARLGRFWQGHDAEAVLYGVTYDRRKASEHGDR